MPEPILPQVALGDSEAVQECIHRYGGLIWALACRQCGQNNDAEDAVQDIFIELWKNADRYDASVSSETTFVAMIARRRLIDRRRRLGRRPSTEPLDELSLADSDRSVGSSLEIREEASQILEVIDGLREDQRHILRLAVQDGLTHREIAEKTGLPLGTVKTHVRRGLIRVRERLTRQSTELASGGSR